MDSKKMAITGAGMVVAGIGLGAIGAVLILPAVVALTASAVEKTGERLLSEVERGSKMVGAMAGNFHRTLSDAKAGMTEMRKPAVRGTKEGA